MDTFGSRLKNCRKVKKYTQKELAAFCNVPEKTLQNWEQDKSIPKSRDILTISMVLDVTPEYLLLGEMHMKTYNAAIEAELTQLNNYTNIEEIKNTPYNSTILAHLEMSDELVDNVKKAWNDAELFKTVKKTEDGDVITETTSCYRNYVAEVILKYTQNRTFFKEKFNITDGMKLITP